MGDQEQQKEQSSWPALLGWGSLAVFSIVFVWLISSQLGETWAKKEQDAIKLTREFQPPGSEFNLGDLTKVYSINAKQKDAYVGEFQWSAVQKDGPDYQVTLLWKEGNKTRQAIWRVDLKTQDIRPQGNEASSLPAWAKEGKIGG